MRTESIRASSFATLLDCSYMWEGIFILGMTKGANGRMHLGTSLHASTAIMDQAKKDGSPLVSGDVDTVFYEIFDKPEYDVDWKHDDLNKTQAESIGLNLNAKYFKDYSQTMTFSEVEKQIDSVIIEVPKYEIAIELTGKMDRSRTVISEWQVEGEEQKTSHGIVDLKFGKMAVNTDGVATTKGHAAQIGVYELLEDMTSDYTVDMPARIIGMQTTKSARIGEGTIHNAKERLLGNENFTGYIEMAASILKSGIFIPNSRSMLCDKRYCPRFEVCPYHE